MTREFEQGLGELLSTLAPYAEELVLVGGWVPVLYARHLDLDSRVRLFTRDIDVAVPRALAIREKSVDELLKEAGLQDCFKSHLKPPTVCYVGQLAGSDVEVEFLTIESGNREGVKVVQKGLNAVGLHYVDLLMDTAFTLDVDVGGRCLSVRVPSPGSFIVQKSLVFPRRADPEKKAKDLYYVFDVWDGCREWRDWIAAEASRLRVQRASWMGRALKNLDRVMADEAGEGVRMLIGQRPAPAFPDLADDQFGQYAWGEMQSLRAIL